MYIVRPACTLSCKGRWNCVKLEAGDLFFLSKDRLYAYEMILSEPPLQKMWIAVQGSQVDWLKQRLKLKDGLYLRQAVHSQSRMLLQSLLNRLKERQNQDQLLLVGLFYQLMAACQAGTETGNQEQRVNNWLDSAKSYMEIHYDEPIKLDEVCEHIGVSRSHFSMVFRQKFGVAPSHYLKQLRMQRARQLVEQSDYSITEIAHSVGYDSLFSFSRAYRQYYGQFPSAARRQAIEEER